MYLPCTDTRNKVGHHHPYSQEDCCGPYRAVLTEYRIEGEMRKAGWFSQERSVKEREEVWWNVVVVTPDQWLRTRLY